jgi:Na+/phosphate symporter
MKNVFKSGFAFLFIGIGFIILSILPFINLLLIMRKTPDPSAVSMGINYGPFVFFAIGIVFCVLGVRRIIKRNKINRQ